MADDKKQAEASKAAPKAAAGNAKAAADDQANAANNAAGNDPAPASGPAAAGKTTSDGKGHAGDQGATDKSAELEGEFVFITAQQPRRRAGLRFGPTPLRVAVSDLTEAQGKAILADPKLSIRQAD